MLKKQNYSSSNKKHIYSLEIKEGNISHDDMIDSFCSMIKVIGKRSRHRVIPTVKRINDTIILLEFEKTKKIPNYISTPKVNYIRKNLKDLYNDIEIEVLPIEVFVQASVPDTIKESQ